MEQTIKLPKTFRYFTYGNIETAETIWFVLHGYGQMPEYFIRKFQGLNPEKHFVVAPEGMHRFYLNGTSGRVGSSWMTKEARLDDISDNMNFLNTLYSNFSKQKIFKTKVLLGFSQGGATAARWHEQGNFNASHFILWASVFPPDLSLPENKSKFSESQNYFIVGDKDEYYNEEHISKMKNYLLENNLQFETIYYDGNHSIQIDCLEQLTNRIVKP
jgi:predicted esterase